MIRVLLVDDQDLVRAGLRGILRQSFGFEIAGECPDGSEALAAADQPTPTSSSWTSACLASTALPPPRLLRADRPSQPVLALTTFDDDDALAGMLRAGAAGFVLKGVPADELHRAVQAVAAGGAWLDPAVTGRVLTVYRDAPTASPPPPGALDRLTHASLTSSPSSVKAAPMPRSPSSSSSAKVR